MQPRHYSQLYRRLRDLDPDDHQRVIRTYEERESEIGRLDALEHFELTVYYADALFATGAYRQHLMMVDLVIEASMRENIQKIERVDGDIFQHLLFRKAVSAYRLRDFETSIHIARELLRINPESELFVRFLRLALFRNDLPLLQFGRASFISCTLATAFLITVNLLVVSIFHPEWVDLWHGVIGIIFAVGLACLVGTYSFSYLRADRQAYRFREEQTNK
jgi:tetratricopeptide (TPR) repeat protein